MKFLILWYNESTWGEVSKTEGGIRSGKSIYDFPEVVYVPQVTIEEGNPADPNFARELSDRLKKLLADYEKGVRSKYGSIVGTISRIQQIIPLP